jgi:hypothetical protein
MRAQFHSDGQQHSRHGRQRHAELVEHAGELRQHEEQQRENDQRADRSKQNGIRQQRSQRTAQPHFAAQQLRQAIQYFREFARRLAGGDARHVGVAEDLRLTARSTQCGRMGRGVR